MPKAILELYSTPGLRRNELTRQGKKDQLASLGVSPEDREKILNELYGPETQQTTYPNPKLESQVLIGS